MGLTYYFVHIRNKNINSTSCSQEKKAYNHLYLKAPINKQGKDLTVEFQNTDSKISQPIFSRGKNVLFNNKISIQEALVIKKYYFNKLQLNNVGWPPLN